MNRRLPSAADVRDAVAAVRRSIALAAAPVPESVTRVAWAVGETGDCAFCGENAPLVRPSSAPLALCELTIAELFAATRPPRAGDATEAVLSAVSRWAGAPRTGELPPQLPPADDPCATCRRAAGMVPDLVAGPEGSLCADCLSRAAGVIPPAIRASALEAEAHAAALEVEDLGRLVETEGPALVRENATLALSLLRLLTAPDPDGSLDAKLLALVRRIA